METRLQQFADRVTDYLPNIIGALLVLFIGWLIAKAIEKLIYKILERTHWGEKVMKGKSVETTTILSPKSCIISSCWLSFSLRWKS